MLDIDGKIVSKDILTERFACDLTQCKGICCVEGNAGAPLLEDEVPILEREFEAYRPYLSPEGVRSIETQGFAVTDEDGDLTTPLIDRAECAYVANDNGVTLCGIERAFREGKCGLMKPVSCHLYPIRVLTFGDGSQGLTYHRWSVCAAACGKGDPIYKALREPIIRQFGEEFYHQLDIAAQLLGVNA